MLQEHVETFWPLVYYKKYGDGSIEASRNHGETMIFISLFVYKKCID